MTDQPKTETGRISRRGLLGASAAAGASALAAPAVAQEQATLEWKMVTSWPKNLPGPGVTAQRIADRIELMSGGRLRVRLYAAGELVPALGVFEAVSAGTAQMAHTASFSGRERSLLLSISRRSLLVCCRMSISPGLSRGRSGALG